MFVQWIKRFSQLHRETLIGEGVLLVLINLTLFPFIWGGLSLQDSGAQAGSLYPSGSRYPASVRTHIRVLDAGGSSWQLEPKFLLDNRIVSKEHTFPIWDPDSGDGVPLAADMQSQPYSPFAWIPTAWPTPRGYNVFVVLRLYIGAVFAFLFGRLFFRTLPAVVAGAAWMYTGYLWLYLTMPELSVSVLTPGMLYGVERLLRRPSIETASLLSILLAAIVLGGMPEVTLLVVSFAFLYAVARVFPNASLRERWVQIAKFAGLGGALGFGLSAILLLPFLEYVPLSFNAHVILPRTGLSEDPTQAHLAANYLAPLIYGLPWDSIFNGGGHSGIRGFFGVSEVCFALVAVLSRVDDIVRRKKVGEFPVFFFLFVVISLLAKRFGFFIVNWIGALPLFRYVIFYKYDEAIIACCVAVLAGAGVSRLAARTIPGWAAWSAISLPLIFLTTVAGYQKGVFAALPAAGQSLYLKSLSGALLFLGVVGLICLAGQLRNLKSAFLALAALSIIVLEINLTYIIPNFYIINGEPTQSNSAYHGAPYVKFLQTHLQPGDRFFAVGSLLYPDWSEAFGVQDVRALNALYPARYLNFARALVPANLESDGGTRFVGTGASLSDPLVQRLMVLSSVRFAGSVKPIDEDILNVALQVSGIQQGPSLSFGSFEAGGVAKPALIMQTPRKNFIVRALIPNNADTLAFSVAGALRGKLPKGSSARISLTMFIATTSGMERMFHRYVDLKEEAMHSDWLDESVPISRYRGESVDLLLSAEATGGSCCQPWVAWSNIRPLDASMRQAPDRFRLVFSEPDAQIYQYFGAIPRVAVYQRVVKAGGEGEALQYIASENFDPRYEVVVEGDDPSVDELARGPRVPVVAGQIEAYESRYVRASVLAARPSLVVLSDTEFQGWHAAVDGRTAQIVPANYLFRGVWVGPGRHIVEFTYRPASFVIGATLTLLSLIALFVLLVLPGLLAMFEGRRELPSRGGSEGWHRS